MSKKRYINVKVPEELKKDFKKLVIDLGITQTEWVKQHIKQDIKDLKDSEN